MNDYSWYPPADRKTIWRLHWKEGLDINDLAELYGCSRRRIITTLKRLSIQRRRQPLRKDDKR